MLLAVTDDADAGACFRACAVDVDMLRNSVQTYIDGELNWLVVKGEDKIEPKATDGFQRALQRAIIHVQSTGREEVTGSHLLVALFSVGDNPAMRFLQEQGMTRYDLINFLSHGVVKAGGVVDAPALIEALRAARDLATQHQHEQVTPAHMLMALMANPDVAQAFTDCDIDPMNVRARLELGWRLIKDASGPG